MAKKATEGPPSEEGKPPERAKKKPPGGKTHSPESAKKRRTRTPRPYPVVSFREATVLGDALFKIGSGEKVRRLTLLEKIERNPASSATHMLITNSGKYGITTGGYSAEYFAFTEL